jgi:hypothetical protein
VFHYSAIKEAAAAPKMQEPSAPPLPACPVSVVERDSEEDLTQYAQRIKALTARHQDSGVLCFTAAALVLCVAFYVFCPRCLFAVLLLSACLCPFFNAMNAPLWLAIVLLTLSGWSFTAGSLSVSWSAGNG